MKRGVKAFCAIFMCVTLLTGCGKKDGVFVANKVSWGDSREDVVKAYGSSSIIVNGVDFLTYKDNFIFEPYKDTFELYPGTGMFFLDDNGALVEVSLQIPIELGIGTSDTTVDFLYGLLESSAKDYYGKDADNVQESQEEGRHLMEWSSEKGDTFIGLLKQPEGSTLPDYTLMIGCNAPGYNSTS